MTEALKPPRKPRSTQAAGELLERYALLQGQAEEAEAARNKAIADTNAVADAIVTPIVAEMDLIRPVIEAWWRDTGHALGPAHSKSMVFGGCLIGLKLGNKALAMPAEGEKAALAALQEVRWGKPFIRVTYAIDKVAVRKGLAGSRKAALADIGFREVQAETFFVERVVQGGTIAS